MRQPSKRSLGPGFLILLLALAFALTLWRLQVGFQGFQKEVLLLLQTSELLLELVLSHELVVKKAPALVSPVLGQNQLRLDIREGEVGDGEALVAA